MKVIVIGGSGHVGTYLCHAWCGRGLRWFPSAAGSANLILRTGHG
jgi:nucleoside-diphosphate-sugar epimerase